MVHPTTNLEAKQVSASTIKQIISNRIAPPIVINTFNAPDEESNDSVPAPTFLEHVVSQESECPSIPALDSSDYLGRHEKFILPQCDWYERLLAIERVVLIAPTIALDNSQGKGSRYKSVINRHTYNIRVSIAVSNQSNNQHTATQISSLPKSTRMVNPSLKMPHNRAKLSPAKQFFLTRELFQVSHLNPNETCPNR